MPHRRIRVSDLLHLVAACLAFSWAEGQNAAAADRKPDDAGEIVERVEKDLRAELMSAEQTNPTMNGTWILLALERDATTRTVIGCTIKVILDQDPAVEKLQRAEIDRIARKFLSDYPYRVSVLARLPMHSVFAKMQSQIDLNPRLAGTEIEAAYFHDSSAEEPDDDGRWKMTVELKGRVTNDDHRSTLTDMANALFESEIQDPVFRIRAVTDKVRVVRKKADGPAVGYCFNQGIQYYRKRDYETAYRFFTKATREAPERIEFQYWRVAALLGHQKEADATVLLENLIKLRMEVTKSSVMESVVSQSLERVQGPIRLRMAQMEKRALCPNCDERTQR